MLNNKLNNAYYAVKKTQIVFLAVFCFFKEMQKIEFIGGMVMELKSCCFIGHRMVENPEQIRDKLRNVLIELLQQNYSVFYFGSKSKFDDIAWEVVTELKKENHLIKRVYVRSMYSEVDEAYKKYLLESYEDTYMPDGIENAGRASYVERNQAMINVSDCCVFYYLERYLPEQRKKAKRDLFVYQPKSGTKVAYDYAVTKRKKIINIANCP